MENLIDLLGGLFNTCLTLFAVLAILGWIIKTFGWVDALIAFLLCTLGLIEAIQHPTTNRIALLVSYGGRWFGAAIAGFSLHWASENLGAKVYRGLFYGCAIGVFLNWHWLHSVLATLVIWFIDYSLKDAHKKPSDDPVIDSSNLQAPL
jgi:hypothetical protein